MDRRTRRRIAREEQVVKENYDSKLVVDQQEEAAPVEYTEEEEVLRRQLGECIGFTKFKSTKGQRVFANNFGAAQVAPKRRKYKQVLKPKKSK